MTSISGGISFTGLGSNDLDYSAIIEQEKSVKSIPKKRLEAWKSDWQLRYDAFDELLTNIQTLQTKLGDLNSINNFLQKKSTSSNQDVATITASAQAADGTYSIDVKSLASNAVLTTNHIFSSKKDVITGTASNSVFSYDYKGKTYTLQIPENCELDYLVTKINGDQNNPGVTASLLKTGGGYVFQLQGKETGEEATLSINSATNLPMFTTDTSKTSYKITKSPEWSGNGSEVINDTGREYSFSFEDGQGNKAEVKLKYGETVDDLVTKLNNLQDVTASLETDASGTRLKLAIANGTVTNVVAPDLAAFGLDTFDSNGLSGVIPPDPDPNVATIGQRQLNTEGDITKKFRYNKEDGTSFSVPILPNDTVNDLVRKINEKYDNHNDPTKPPSTGIKAKLVTENGKSYLQLEEKDGKAVKIGTNTLTFTELNQSAQWQEGVETITGADDIGWHERKSQDAVFTINGSDKEFTSESNSLTEVFSGAEVTLHSVGKSQFTVATSTEETKNKVQEFMDAYNEMLTAFDKVSKYDEDKEVKSRGTSKDENGNYVIDFSSQFAYQKGGVLTGNYGVQTVLSDIKQMVVGKGAGFRSMNNADDVYGDRFISLSAIGIIADSDEGSPTFGQLRFMTDDERVEKGGSDSAINPYKTFEMALAEDPEATLAILVGSSGTTDDYRFSYEGSIGGSLGAKAGTYKVEYTISTPGVRPDFIMVDGVKANLDTTTKTYVPASGSAAGVEIAINDGLDVVGTVSGNLRIKQGKIPQLVAKLKQELHDEPVPSDGKYLPGHTRGSLVVLKANYKTIMENIQKKIDTETTRLQNWETRERSKYARLDTLLGQYNNQMSSNSASLSSLNSGSDS